MSYSRFNGRTDAKMQNVFSQDSYTNFVRQLSKALRDPKVRLTLRKGLQDGVKRDDIIRSSNARNKVSSLRPIQSEIDLSKSLAYIGAHPENIAPILRGETLTAKHFGGYPVVTSKGDFVVDGHHRWSQVYMINPNAKVESIDLNVANPQNALVASQAAIASETSHISQRRVGAGQNIYAMSQYDIEREMKQHFTPAFYIAFYRADPGRFRCKEDVHDHILDNIRRMKAKSRPVTLIKRSVMPVFDEVGALEATSRLERGEINLKKPFVRNVS